MTSNRNFGNTSDGAKYICLHIRSFAESIILYFRNTPTNDIIKSGIASYPKRIFPVSGDNERIFIKCWL